MAFWDFLRSKKPEPPPVEEPPLPHDPQLATQYLRMAQAEVDEQFKVGTFIGRGDVRVPYLPHLSRAADAVMKARAHDPAAQLLVEDKKLGEYTVTCDSMAAYILNIESVTYYDQAYYEMEREETEPLILKARSRKQILAKQDAEGLEYLKQSLTAAEKAVTYQPHNAQYLFHLYKVYVALKQEDKAKAIIARAYAIAPENTDIFRAYTTGYS